MGHRQEDYREPVEDERSQPPHDLELVSLGEVMKVIDNDDRHSNPEEIAGNLLRRAIAAHRVHTLIQRGDLSCDTTTALGNYGVEFSFD